MIRIIKTTDANNVALHTEGYGVIAAAAQESSTTATHQINKTTTTTTFLGFEFMDNRIEENLSYGLEAGFRTTRCWSNVSSCILASLV